MTVRRYWYGDTGAPTQSGNYYGNDRNQAGIYAALQTGYGSKPGAGWTRLYTSASAWDIWRTGGGSQASLYMTYAPSYTTDILAHGMRSYDAVTGNRNARFPSPYQNGGDVWVTRATTSAVGTSNWEVIADSKFAYILQSCGGGQWAKWTAFGDYIPFRASDTRCAIIMGGLGSASGAALNEPFRWSSRLNIQANDNVGGVYAMTDHTGSYISTPCGLMSDLHHSLPHYGSNGSAISGYGTQLAVNDLATGGIMISRVIVHSGGVPRGYVPGLWHTANTGYLTDGNIVTGTGEHAGRQWRVVATGTPPTQSVVLIEISDTWYV